METGSSQIIQDSKSKAPEALKSRFRSGQKATFIRIENRPASRGGPITIEDELPLGKGWMQGNGAIDHVNAGWRLKSEYEADQHRKEVEAKQAEVQAKQDAEVQAKLEELETLKAQMKAEKKDRK